MVPVVSAPPVAPSVKAASLFFSPVLLSQGEAMSLTTSRGQKFSCLVPQQPSDSSRNKSELVTFPNVTDILLTLSGRPCLTKVTGKRRLEGKTLRGKGGGKRKGSHGAPKTRLLGISIAVLTLIFFVCYLFFDFFLLCYKVTLTTLSQVA